MLNDFIFCPYSIFLHNVYLDTDEGLYHATPQTVGRISHKATDSKTSSTSKNDIFSLSVYSCRFRLMGKIDVFRSDKKLLIERKKQLKQIFKGQIYQLWAQYLCLIEMGYEVKQLAFYEISSNKTIPISLPDDNDIKEFSSFIETFRNFNPEKTVNINPNKCKHCIYCNLCDKTEEENVYQ